MKILNTDTLLIISLVSFFILYSNVSLTSPIAFGDEGFYAAETRWIAENGIYPVYEPMRGTEILHEKIVIPPLYSIIQSFMWLIAGESGVKFLIPVFSVLTAAMLYLFFRRIKKPNTGLAAAFIFLSMPSLVTYSVLNYTDALLCLMFTCSAYFGYLAFESRKLSHSVMTGAFAGLTFLSKGSGFLIIAILILYFLLSMKFKKIVNWKTMLLILIVSVVIVSPWIARSLLLYNAVCYHPILLKGCDPTTDVEIPKLQGLEFAGRIEKTGTEASVWDIGFLNYADFAFGWAALLLFIFGIANLIVDRKKTNLLFVSWFLIFIPIFYMSTIEVLGATGRAEDTARYTLPLIISMAAIARIFVEDIFESLKKHSRAFGALLVIILLVPLVFFAQQKLDTMKGVKGFSVAFFQGCNWVEKNTPKDSILFSIYAHQTMYFCDREAISFLPDNAEIQLTNNDTSYEHLKLHGINYVFIQAFAVSNVAYREVITTSFLNYLDSSGKFKKVYDNTATYGNSGVIVYQVL